MNAHPATGAKRGTVLFVDDERRVLTSMRAMFRRDYEVLLANSGVEALGMLRDEQIDVIVSDQRMPGMTGVEVLKQVKDLAPESMRILLTGYADLKAIEASINEGEVFRYLTKPCPSDELKEAVSLAVDVAQKGRARREEAQGVAEAPVAAAPVRPMRVQPPAPTPVPADMAAESEEIELIELWPLPSEPVVRPPQSAPRVDLSAPRANSSTSGAMREKPVEAPPPSAGVAAPPTAPPVVRPVLVKPRRAPKRNDISGDVDLLALTNDQAMVDVLEQALDGSHKLHVATDLDGAIAALESHPIGVLVTDIAVSQDEITNLTTALKQHVPELITVVASDRSDAQVLIDLINYGQIFRFLLKPLHAGQCRLSMESAVSRHRDLAADPSLVRRHTVAARSTAAEGVVSQVIDRVRRLRNRFFAANGVA